VWEQYTKGPKQDSQNRLRSPMPEGGVHSLFRKGIHIYQTIPTEKDMKKPH
jgi:hypothetical protein